MDHGPGLPSRPYDKRKIRPFQDSPVRRAPKRDNPFGTPRELSAVQFNVGYVEAGLTRPPLPPRYNFVDSFPPQETMDPTPTARQPHGSSVEPDESEEQHSTHPLDQDTFYYDVRTSELRSKHGESSQVVAVSDIPEDLKFRELETGEEYNKVFDTITKRYDGVDGLTEEEATHPERRGWVITKKCNAIISFDSEARAATETTPATHGPYFGQITKPDREGNHKAWIQLDFIMNSQHPAIALVLQQEGENDVTCFFYTNRILRDLDHDADWFQVRHN